MKYISTRDPSIQLTASQAILKGISPEGGLFVPEEFPQVDLDFIRELEGLTYWERAERVMALYLDDFSREDLKACTEGAYRGTFDGDQPAPVRAAGDLRLLELWHGPTCAFKDMALQMLPRLVSTARRNLGDDRRAIVLVATSGDTGKAALEGFRDVDGTGIAVFYPVDGVSQIQRLQMATQQGSNVAVQAVEGNFDDCQTGVKHLFAKEQLAERLGEQKMYLTSANSINWGRPIGRLICASNRNDVLTEFLTTGTYNRKREFHLTNTPSMDILISSNLERYLFELFGREARAVAYCMYRLNEGGGYSVTAEALDQIREEFAAYSCDDQKTLDTIREIHDRCGYVMDTHTAVAVNALEQYQQDRTPALVVSTASPFKFADSVLTALGREVPAGEFDCLRTLSEVSGLAVPASLAQLEELPVRFEGAVRPQEMEHALLHALRKMDEPM